MLLAKGNQRALAMWTIATNHEVVLPLEASAGVLVDIQGQKKDISWPTNQLRLTVSGNPRYLLIAD